MKVLQLVSPLGLRAQLKTRGATQRPSARVRCLRCIQAISQDEPPRVDATTFEKESTPKSEEIKISVDAQTFENELLPISVAEDSLGCPWEDDWDKYCEMVTEQVKVDTEIDDFLDVDESLLSMDDDDTFLEDSLDMPEEKPEKKKKNRKIPPEFCRPSERGRWKTIQSLLRPTQTALGWDWSLYKLQNFRTEEDAQTYMDTKPVPYIQRGSKKYVVDHHHTLVALEMSGWNPKVTLQCVDELDAEERGKEAFWGYLEGRGWAFMRDPDYTRISHKLLPKTFHIQEFRNDVYRSMGGFARKHKILKRGKTLDDKLFFEFRWGYFFWLHRENEFNLWGDDRNHRGWQSVLKLIGQFDEDFLIPLVEGDASTEEKLLFVEEKVLPSYAMLIYYLRYLCYEYADSDEKNVDGLRRIFGVNHSVLPGKVLGGRREVWGESTIK